MKNLKPMKIMTGPCVIEDRSLVFEIAQFMKDNLSPIGSEIELYFKASYDKANRTSIDSFRGPGIDKGLEILAELKEKFGFPIITDYHNPNEAEKVGAVADILQVPAFLCRQTDMIVEGAKAKKKFGGHLNIKKGQFLSPVDAKNIIEKATHFLSKDQILMTERGSSFGYNNLIVDMASFSVMKNFGVDCIFDITHSVQKPGGDGKITGGKREQAFVLAKAAAAAGADGFFLEIHPRPDEAKSDKTTCLPLTEVREIIETLLKIRRTIQE